MMAPKSRQDAAATEPRGSDFELSRERLLHFAGECGIIGDQDGLRVDVVLGLGQEIGCDPVGMTAPVRHDQHFGRTGDHVDADLSKDEALGRRHIGISRPHDLGNGRDGLGAVGERGHSLRTADAIDFVDPRKLCCRKHERRELALRGRDDHHHARHACDLRGDRIHQDRGWIGGSAPGHVETHRFDCSPARSKLDSERVGEAVVLRELPAVIGFNPVAGERERIEGFWIARGEGPFDLAGLNPEAKLAEMHPVKSAAQLDQRPVAAKRDVRNDGAYSGLYAGHYLAFLSEQRAERGREIGSAAVEADRHDACSHRTRRGRVTAQWRGE